MHGTFVGSIRDFSIILRYESKGLKACKLVWHIGLVVLTDVGFMKA